MEHVMDPIIVEFAKGIEKQKDEIQKLKLELRKREREVVDEKGEERDGERDVERGEESRNVRSRVEEKEIMDSTTICHFCFGNHRTDRKNCFYMSKIFGHFHKEVEQMRTISREFEIPVDIITKILQQYFRKYIKNFPRQVWNSYEGINLIEDPIELPETFDISPLIEKAKNVKKYRENFKSMFPLTSCDACHSVYHTFSNCKINLLIQCKYPLEYSKTVYRRHYILPPREHWVKIQYHKYIKTMMANPTFDINKLPHLADIDE